MKKIILLVLTIALMLTVAGCGSEDVRGETSPAQTAEEKAPVEEPAEEPAEEAAEFAFGTTESNVYKSEFLSLGCELDSTWVFYTDDEILEVNQLSQDMVGEETAELLENSDVITDMYAQNTESGSTLNLNLEKLNVVQNKILDEEDYVDISLEPLVTALEEMGMENMVSEKRTVSFLGEDRICIYVSGTVQGVELYEIVMPFKCGRYMANISVCTPFEDGTQAILDCFYKL